MNNSIALNTSYEILTPTGWQDFIGIKRSIKDTIKICFTDGTHTICTHDHTFMCGHRQIRAASLLPAKTLGKKTIVSVSQHEILDVYDPINVAGGNVYYSDDIISHNCQFLGSSGTLINASRIAQLAAVHPEYSKDGLDILEYPIRNIRDTNNNILQGHTYILVADVSRGLNGDYSAFTVVDVTSMPYKLVAKFRDNMISPLLYPNIIHKVARDFNNAYVLVEIKENGQQIADILQHELEYENILFISRGNGGQHLTAGFGGRHTTQNGVMTSSQVKRIGCDVVKTLIEESKLLINDADTISEMSTFIQVKNSYAADEGYHDDLMMCLVLFGWLTTSSYFKELTDTKFRERIFQTRMDEINNSLTPFGGYDDGQSNNTKEFEDSVGNKWDLEDAKTMMEEVGWLLK